MIGTRPRSSPGQGYDGGGRPGWCVQRWIWASGPSLPSSSIHGAQGGISPTYLYAAWRNAKKNTRTRQLSKKRWLQRVMRNGTDQFEYASSVSPKSLAHIKGPSFVGISGEPTGSELERPLTRRRISSGDATDAAAPIDPTFPPRPSERVSRSLEGEIGRRTKKVSLDPIPERRPCPFG